jgi:hypothetical protein
MYWLFSYGSNHPEQLSGRLERPVTGGRAAYLENYRLTFTGESGSWDGKGVANVIPAKGKEVCGYITPVSPADLRKLDVYEGAEPAFDESSMWYYKTFLTVKAETHSGWENVESVVYLAGDLRRNLTNPPGKRYINAIKKTITSYWKPYEDFSACLKTLQDGVDYAKENRQIL